MNIKHKFTQNSIRAFLLVWMSGLIVCSIIFAISLILSTNALQSMASRIYTDSIALESARRLESAILREQREALLSRVTLDSYHKQARNDMIEETEKIIKELHSTATSAKEGKLINDIEKTFIKFKKMELGIQKSPLKEISLLTDALLKLVFTFEEQNKKQIEKTIENSKRLDKMVDRTSLILIVIVVLIIIGGSIILINRVVYPIFALINAANKFGSGDYKVKINIQRKDELGILCETFNNMVESIYDLEQERLNLIATMAHDLKNPLILIGAAARLIKEKGNVSEEQSTWLERIIGQTEHIESMIYDLMDSIRIETGNMELQMSIFDITSLVRNIQLLQNEMIKTHKIIFKGEYECLINGDKKRLERVISNLISNAVKYSPEQTTILLKVEKHDSMAIIIVKDEGVGIAPDEIEKMFLPFKRLSRTQGMAKGTGLGLFSVRKIIEGHNGKINIISKPKIGTTVEIFLPCAVNPKSH